MDGILKPICGGLAIGWMVATVLSIMMLAGPEFVAPGDLHYVLAAYVITPTAGALCGAIAYVLED